MNASAYRFPSRGELTRMPALASTILHFNLPGETLQLRTQDSWQRGTGRSSKTLAKYPDFHVVLVLMKANTRMNEHHVDARISIHALEGRIRVRMSDEVVDVSAGELIALDYAILHDSVSWRGRGITAPTQLLAEDMALSLDGAALLTDPATPLRGIMS